MPWWVKFLIGLFAGSGVALVVIDRVFATGNPAYWHSDPPEGMFTGLGIGCLVAAAIWYALFVGPRGDRTSA